MYTVKSYRVDNRQLIKFQQLRFRFMRKPINLFLLDFANKYLGPQGIAVFLFT